MGQPSESPPDKPDERTDWWGMAKVTAFKAAVTMAVKKLLERLFAKRRKAARS